METKRHPLHQRKNLFPKYKKRTLRYTLRTLVQKDAYRKRFMIFWERKHPSK